MPKPWYIDGFGAHYLELYAHRNDREALQSLKLLDDAGLELEGRILLDLGCGPGRHLAALRRRGARVLGLDLSPELLQEAARRGVRSEGVVLLRGDMRNLPLGEKCVDGVLSMFTSFGYFPEDIENWTVLDEVARVLRPEGFYFFDFLNRGKVLRDLRPESEVTGESFTVREQRRVDGERVFKEVRILESKSGEEKLRYEESVRLFRHEEIVEAAAARGLCVQKTWGSYTGRPYDEIESPRLILLFQRDGS